MKWKKGERRLPRPRFSLAVQVSDYRNQSSQDSNYVSHNLKGFFYFFHFISSPPLYVFIIHLFRCFVRLFRLILIKNPTKLIQLIHSLVGFVLFTIRLRRVVVFEVYAVL